MITSNRQDFGYIKSGTVSRKAKDQNILSLLNIETGTLLEQSETRTQFVMWPHSTRQNAWWKHMGIRNRVYIQRGIKEQCTFGAFHDLRRWIGIILSSPTSSPLMTAFLQSWKEFLDRQRFSYAECPYAPCSIHGEFSSIPPWGCETVQCKLAFCERLLVRLHQSKAISYMRIRVGITNRRPFPFWGSGSNTHSNATSFDKSK